MKKNKSSSKRVPAPFAKPEPVVDHSKYLNQKPRGSRLAWFFYMLCYIGLGAIPGLFFGWPGAIFGWAVLSAGIAEALGNVLSPEPSSHRNLSMSEPSTHEEEGITITPYAMSLNIGAVDAGKEINH